MFFRDYEGRDSVQVAVLCCAPLSQMALFIAIIFLQPSMLMVECIIRHGNKQIEMSYYKRVVLVSVAFH